MTSTSDKTRAAKTARKKPAAKKSAAKKKDPRDDIDVRAIIKALEHHILNGEELTAVKLNAALALIKQALPDAAKAEAPDAARAHEDALMTLE